MDSDPVIENYDRRSLRRPRFDRLFNETKNISVSDIVDLYQKLHNDTNLEADNKEDEYFKYVVEGVLLTTVSLFGLLGNAVAIAVLSRPNMKGSFSTLLMGLSSFDTLYLLVGLGIFGLPALSPKYLHSIFPTIIPTFFGIGHIGRVGSVFITVSVTLERYFAIVHPLKHFWQNKYLLSVSATVSVIYNIPKFFELTNKLQEDTGQRVVSGTVLRSNHYYVTFYIFWSKFIFVEIIPYFIIISLNLLIIQKIRSSGQFRNKFKRSGTSESISGRLVTETDAAAAAAVATKQQYEANLGVILVVISVFFVICQSVKIIPDLYESIFCRLRVVEEGMECVTTSWVESLISVSHLMLAINSSTNFVVYICRGEKFRKALSTHLQSIREHSIPSSFRERQHYSSKSLSRPRGSQQSKGKNETEIEMVKLVGKKEEGGSATVVIEEEKMENGSFRISFKAETHV